jgi:hypothetical protein
LEDTAGYLSEFLATAREVVRRISELPPEARGEALPVLEAVEKAIEVVQPAAASISSIPWHEPAFDALMTLTPYIEAVAREWARIRRRTGMEAAREIVSQVDNVEERWRARWGRAWEYAWRAREHSNRRSDEAWRVRPERSATSMEPLLDLRYATGLPLTRIADLFDLSPSGVQARLAAFEGQVVEAIAASVAEGQLPQDWQVEQRRPGSDFTVVHRSSHHVVHIDAVPIWRERDTSAGRPREASPVWRLTTGRAEVFAAVFVEKAEVLWVPASRLRAHAAPGTLIGQVSFQQALESTPELSFQSLFEAVKFAE